MIQITASAILGRAGGETPTDPLINLADYDAEKKGVSRRHAMLIREDERLLITDLGSTNHTYLNGQQLQENDRLVLRDGDEIRLGKLSIKIFYK
jgi:pSer/pThr/pTyr-binding forkhead associated (FHA) protein